MTLLFSSILHLNFIYRDESLYQSRRSRRTRAGGSAHNADPVDEREQQQEEDEDYDASSKPPGRLCREVQASL